MLSHSKVSQKGRYPGFAKITRMGFVMEQDVAFHPLDSGFFGTEAVVAQPQCIAPLIQQFGLSHGRLPAPLAFLFRLPFLSLTRCFSDDSLFYTPEKPIRQRAFRVSTSFYAVEA